MCKCHKTHHFKYADILPHDFYGIFYGPYKTVSYDTISYKYRQ